MTEMRDVIIFVGFWRSPVPPSLDATILNYLSDSERGAPLSFVGFWRPPPPTDATILNYLNDRERGALLFIVGFWRPPMTPLQTPQYFTILMTEREGAPLSFCKILAPPPPQCPPHDSKILYYLNDKDEGRYYFCRILAPPNAPSPPLTPQYLTILMTERGGRHHLL